MSEIEKLKREIQSLKDKNENLELKLKIAKLWMIRQIKESVKKISKSKISRLTWDSKKNFTRDNLEDIITNKIRNYFWDYILMNINSSIIDNLVSAEIAYYQLKQNPNFDGFSVISSYHKAIDGIIEQIITKWYRKFALKQKHLSLRKNDLIEKSLNSVVHKKYILSIWRLYWILIAIKENKELYDFWKVFKQFLDKYIDLKKIFLDDEFLKIFREIMNSEILWKKRHSWIISFVETRKARKLIVWNLKDKNSFIFKLLKYFDMEY